MMKRPISALAAMAAIASAATAATPATPNASTPLSGPTLPTRYNNVFVQNAPGTTRPAPGSTSIFVLPGAPVAPPPRAFSMVVGPPAPLVTYDKTARGIEVAFLSPALRPYSVATLTSEGSAATACDRGTAPATTEEKAKR